jgi:glycosyltransferase involved in cell wall biosynthesis
MSLFEALATGVPVVSTPVGWAPTMIRGEVNGFIVQSAEEMASAIERIRERREDWFQRRAEIRASLGGYTLEGWVRENISLALQLLEACKTNSGQALPVLRTG